MLLLVLSTLFAQHPFNFFQQSIPVEIVGEEEEGDDDSDIVVIPDDDNSKDESIVN